MHRLLARTHEYQLAGIVSLGHMSEQPIEPSATGHGDGECFHNILVILASSTGHKNVTEFPAELTVSLLHNGQHTSFAMFVRDLSTVGNDREFRCIACTVDDLSVGSHALREV